MREINLIVVHCSATRENAVLTPKDLEYDHRRRGFKGTGYHYYISRDGSVYPTRSLHRAGAHARGFNAHSIGICYEGGLDRDGRPHDTRTADQRRSLRMLIGLLRDRFPGIRVCGHRDLSPDLNGNGEVDPAEWLKQCPCFDAAREYDECAPSATDENSADDVEILF